MSNSFFGGLFNNGGAANDDDDDDDAGSAATPARTNGGGTAARRNLFPGTTPPAARPRPVYQNVMAPVLQAAATSLETARSLFARDPELLLAPQGPHLAAVGAAANEAADRQDSFDDKDANHVKAGRLTEAFPGQAAVVVPPAGKANEALTPAELLARFGPLLKDPARRQQTMEHIKDVGEFYRELATNQDEKVYQQIVGNLTAACTAVIQELHLGAHVKQPKIIVAGFEKAGKTTVVSAILGLQVSYSDTGRATVAPTEITCISEPASTVVRATVTLPAWRHRNEEFHSNLTVDQARDIITSFMREVRDSDSGAGVCDATVKLELRGPLKFSGVIVDLPGLTQSVQTDANVSVRQQNARFQGGIQNMILRELSSDTHDGTLLFVHRADHRQDQANFEVVLQDAGGDVNFDNAIANTRRKGRFLTIITSADKYFNDKTRGKQQLDEAAFMLQNLASRGDHNTFGATSGNDIVTFAFSLDGVSDNPGDIRSIVDRNSVTTSAAFESNKVEVLKRFSAAETSKSPDERLPGWSAGPAATHFAKEMFQFQSFLDKLTFLMHETINNTKHQLVEAIGALSTTLATLAISSDAVVVDEDTVSNAAKVLMDKWCDVAEGNEQAFPAVDVEPDCKPELHEQFPNELSDSMAMETRYNDKPLRLVLEKRVKLVMHSKVDQHLAAVVGNLPGGSKVFSGHQALTRAIARIYIRLMCVCFAEVEPDLIMRVSAPVDLRMQPLGVDTPGALYKTTWYVVREMYNRFLPYAKKVVMTVIQDLITYSIHVLRMDNTLAPDIAELIKYKHTVGILDRQMMQAATAIVDEVFEDFNQDRSQPPIDEVPSIGNLQQVAKRIQDAVASNASADDIAGLEAALDAVMGSSSATNVAQQPHHAWVGPYANLSALAAQVPSVKSRVILLMMAHHHKFARDMYEVLQTRLVPKLFGRDAQFSILAANMLHRRVYRTELVDASYNPAVTRTQVKVQYSLDRKKRSKDDAVRELYQLDQMGGGNHSVLLAEINDTVIKPCLADLRQHI